MSYAVQRLPGDIYKITRRCDRGECRLRPDDELNEVIKLAVAVASERHQVEVIALSALSNFMTMVVHDPSGLLSDFMRDVNSLIGRYGRWRDGAEHSFWDNAAGHRIAQPLEDLRAVVRAVADTLVQPVKLGEVAAPKAWPGVITNVADIGTGRGLPARRPERFFREQGPVPKAAELVTHAPPGVAAARFRQLVTNEVNRRLEILRRKMRASGRPYALVDRILSRDVFYRPSSGEMNPTGLTEEEERRHDLGSPEPSEALLEREATFRREHRRARLRFAAGERDVVFPAGTYEAFRYYGARRASPPPTLAAA